MRFVLAFCALFFSETAGAQGLREFGPAAPPYGFVEFCKRAPAECAKDNRGNAFMAATPKLLGDLHRVNEEVNNAITPRTDLENYGVREWWTIPKLVNGRGFGDCEDYALLKRHILIKDYHWPVSALRITVVRDEKGEGHAVLIALTSTGDYVLDNKHDTIGLIGDFPYQPIERQSGTHPQLWVSLQDQSEIIIGAAPH